MPDKDLFQPAGGSWEEIAELGGFRSVIDPNDVAGNKNNYIDAMHKAAIHSAVNFNLGMTVLDFGCGMGRLTKYFSRLVKKVVGVDITERMLEKAREMNGASNIEYHLIDGIHLPLKDDSVDLIIAVGTLQYAVRDKNVFDRIMREFHRVSTRGGRICFLEQLNKSGTLVTSVKKEAYIDGARKYFNIEKDYPVRLGGIRPLAHKIMFTKYFPRLFYPFIAFCEVMRTKHIKEKNLARFPYADCLFFGHVLK